MGKLVAFWSPYIGKARVTSSLCAIAGAFGTEYPELTVAISHSPQEAMDLEEKLYYREAEGEPYEWYAKSGIAALKLQCRQAMLTTEKIRRSAIPLCMKSLFLYPYAEAVGTPDELTVCLLTETIKKEYDILFLDIKSGVQKESGLFLQAADVVVVVLPQDPVLWNRFFQKEIQYLEGKNYCILIGGYLEKSKHGRKYFQRKKEFREELAGVIPVNAGFFDAMSEGKALEYFLKNHRLKKNEENYGFIVQTKKAAEYIRKKVFVS